MTLKHQEVAKVFFKDKYMSMEKVKNQYTKNIADSFDLFIENQAYYQLLECR